MATGRIGVTPTLRTRWSKQPSAGTTSLSGLDDNSVSLVYDVGYEAVYRNGVLLSRGNDYTATSGTSITLIDATLTGDVIEVLANQLVPLTDAISKGQFTAKGALLSATAASTPGVITVGANDTVLTADSSTATGLKWATPAAGGMTLLSTTTLTGATTTISGISGAYNELYVIVFGMTNATANNEFYCYPNASLTGVYYESLRNGAVSTKTNGGISLAGGLDYLRTSANNASLIRIQSYAATTYYKPMQFSTIFTDATSVKPCMGAGGIGTNSAITSLQFDALGGDFTSGTVLIYGVK